jgi:hypothetical protein
MRVIIAGGRDYKPTIKATVWLLEILDELKPDVIISGHAKGADTFGEEIADLLKIEKFLYPAEWDKYGLAAGYKRNEIMAKIANACILFPGGKGTDSMKKLAEDYKLEIFEYKEI